jgi:class 3 adenylate cyclase/CHASE2 domain-containing sensor protein
MATTEKRRLLIDATLIGVLLTLLVAAADALGWLTPLERWFYDQRALLCQHWMPPPTDRLVHVDIDDAALDAVGRWPWHRTDIAEIVDELRLAGAKAVALDITLSEPESPQVVRLNKSFVEVDHDQRLVDAVGAAGNVVVAATFPFRREPVDRVYEAVKASLAQDPERTEAQVVEAVRAQGLNGDRLSDQVRGRYVTALTDVLFDRVRAEGAAGGFDVLRKKLLPRTDPLVDTVAANALRAALVRAEAWEALRRHALPVPAGCPPVVGARLAEAPIAPLSRNAAGAGFVDYTQASDARVRSVPLLLEHDGVLYPQLGLALAWQLLGADPKALKVADGAVTVPRGALGALSIPVHTTPAAGLFDIGRDVPLSANLSWFGGRDWTRMYDRGGAAASNQHVPITSVFDPCRVNRRMRSNNVEASYAWELVIPDDLYDEFVKRKLGDGDVDGYLSFIDRVLADPVLPAANDPKRKEAQDALAKLRAIAEANRSLRKELDEHRARLHGVFNDKAVLVGWTATGVIADFLPTSLHPRCPGVVLHGVVFNQIMTGEVWRTLPPWVTLLVTLLVGGLATLAVSFLSPARALASAALLAVGYLLVNGYLLFDYRNLILGAAAPVVAIGAVFSGGTLAKLAVERWERARITRRFSSYVDPKLVEYVLKHPEQAHFEGQIRELSVVFCDVAGFTKLTETRGTDTVRILNELWGVVVPAIQRRGAYINKFMGDGIMFFYGAPEQSPAHARDAVATVLEVRKAVERFNAEVAPAHGWPALGLRCGVSTGNMVVGDAGHTTNPAEIRADYTVLGDNVNLGSRLEAANKAVGTGALVTERTFELSRDAGILFRPVGKLCVVGKKTGVMTYEPMALLDDATDQQKALAAATKAVVESFINGRLEECVEAIARMESVHGRSRLTDLYRERCEWFQRVPSPEPFDCQIVLTEK